MQIGKHTDYSEHFSEMNSLLHDESDRGAVLTVSAYLEHAIRTTLISHCKNAQPDLSDKEANLLFKTFDSQFANFSSCIRLARALGILSKWHQDVLIKFGAWRNQFAHGASPKNLTDDDLKVLLKPSSAKLSQFFEALGGSWGSHLGKSPRADFQEWASAFSFTLAIVVDQDVRNMGREAEQ